jgi:hypothetical protein
MLPGQLPMSSASREILPANNFSLGSLSLLWFNHLKPTSQIEKIVVVTG